MTDNDKMREEFEDWYMRIHPHIHYMVRTPTDGYANRHAQELWGIWQAAKSVPDAELERLRKDAERYRWLRSPSVGPATVWRVCMEPMDGGLHTLKSDSFLDEAIDAAIAGVHLAT